ncbi:MAG: MATE family efflux transporter [Clostridia bacterium]|nr:MATE family efflux transporter [Clostridia bacterium]
MEEGLEREEKGKDSKHFLTEGPIKRSLLFFTLPLFLSNLFQQLYNTVDTVLVGWCIPEALPAVSTSGHLVFLLVGFFSGLASGASVFIANFFGAKKYDEMEKAIHTNVLFGVICGAVFSLLGSLLTPYILMLLDTSEASMPYGIEYFRVYFAGSFTVVLYNVFVGILQAVGDSKRPLYYLIISSCLNVLLDYLFLAVFGWGVWSAALATVLSQGVSMVLCIIRLATVKDVYRLSFKKLRFYKGMLSGILKIGLPSGIQNSVIALANLFILRQVNSFDDEAIVAGLGCYMKVEGFAFLPITCFSLSLSTFVSQNLGAKEYDRAKKGARFGILCSVGSALVIGTMLFIFAPFFMSLFTADSAVINHGVNQLRTEAFFYGLLAYAHCIAGICRGAGRASVPMIIMLSCWCVFRVIALAICLAINKNVYFVYAMYPVTWAISCIVFAIYYYASDWVHAYEKKPKKSSKNEAHGEAQQSA